MSSKKHTFVKSRAEETKVLFMFVFLGILSSAWLIYHFAKLALFEIQMFIP